MPKVPGLYKKRNSQRRVPNELMDVIGKKEINCSLKTSDPQLAAKLARQRAVETDALFEQHRAGAFENDPISILPKTPLDVKKLCDNLYQKTINDEFLERNEVWREVEANRDAFWAGEIIRLPTEEEYYWHVSNEELGYSDTLQYCIAHRNKQRLDVLENSFKKGDYSEFLDLAKEHTTDRGKRVSLARDLLAAKLKALGEIVKGLEDWEPPQSLKPTQSVEVHKGPLLSEAMDQWVFEKTREGSWTDKTKTENEKALLALIEISGDKAIDSYDKSDARDFKDVFSQLPKNAKTNKKFNDLSLSEIAKKAKREQLVGLTPKTINKRIGAVSSFFDWAISQYDGGMTNPFRGIKLSIKTTAREERHPFTKTELTKILGAIDCTLHRLPSWRNPSITCERRSTFGSDKLPEHR